MDGWVIEVAGRRWTNEDVRGRHVAIVADLLVDSWELLEPWRGPRLLLAWVTALLTDEVPMGEALDVVHELTLDELMAACRRLPVREA